MEEQKEVNTPEETSPLEGAIASSPEAMEEATKETKQEPESATPKQAETPEEPQQAEEGKIPYDRFKEKVDEVNWYKQQLEASLNKPVAQPTPTQPQDPYANMTPEEQVFWRKQRDIAREEATKVMNNKVMPQLNAGVQEIARLQAEQFFTTHQDIKKGSQEETAISTKIRQGYLPEDAYRAVMWDSKVGQVQQTRQNNTQQRLQDKQKANVVSPSSNSPQTVVPQGLSYEDELRQKMNSEWNGEM